MSNAMQPRDRWIPWYFVMFFVGLALVDGVMVTLAVRTQSGPVTDHPYEKGLSYNRVVEAEAVQEALGWSGVIGYEKGVLRFNLSDRDHAPLIFDKATAVFTRPTQAAMDFTVALKGAQTAISFPAKGLWDVRIDADVKGVHYQQSKRIIVE